jgi:hypothetical protein
MLPNFLLPGIHHRHDECWYATSLTHLFVVYQVVIRKCSTNIWPSSTANDYYFCYCRIIEQVVITAVGSFLVATSEAGNRHPVLPKMISGYCQ